MRNRASGAGFSSPKFQHLVQLLFDGVESVRLAFSVAPQDRSGYQVSHLNERLAPGTLDLNALEMSGNAADDHKAPKLGSQLSR
jgi:hypothetical protein